jgi:hypothetical protein
MKERIIENGIEYELKGDIYYPILTVGEQTSYEIGKYGNLHLEFIEKHRKGRYTTLLVEGKLNEYLHNIDVEAHEQVEKIITRMAEQSGVNEELKASSPLRWIQMMNNIKATAEEITLAEVVYR